MKNLVPLKYRVLVQPVAVEEKTRGGLFLPEQVVRNEKLQTQEGIVVSIGAEAEVGILQVGDTVIYAKYGGKWIKDKNTGNDYVCLNDEDLLVIIKDTEVEVSDE